MLPKTLSLEDEEVVVVGTEPNKLLLLLGGGTATGSDIGVSCGCWISCGCSLTGISFGWEDCEPKGKDGGAPKVLAVFLTEVGADVVNKSFGDAVV